MNTKKINFFIRVLYEFMYKYVFVGDVKYNIDYLIETKRFCNTYFC